jgi:hypothetical protein
MRHSVSIATANIGSISRSSMVLKNSGSRYGPMAQDAPMGIDAQAAPGSLPRSIGTQTPLGGRQRFANTNP